MPEVSLWDGGVLESQKLLDAMAQTITGSSGSMGTSQQRVTDHGESDANEAYQVL